MQMTSDHKPDVEFETKRITKSGGYVSNVNGIPRVMGNLSLSRSLGDWYMRPYVIPHPGVSRWKLRGDEQYLLLATDGIWDVVSSAEACSVLDSNGGLETPEKGMLALTALARERFSQDNITVLVVDMRR
jgi:protein phosphatase 2C